MHSYRKLQRRNLFCRLPVDYRNCILAYCAYVARFSLIFSSVLRQRHCPLMMAFLKSDRVTHKCDCEYVVWQYVYGAINHQHALLQLPLKSRLPTCSDQQKTRLGLCIFSVLPIFTISSHESVPVQYSRPTTTSERRRSRVSSLLTPHRNGASLQEKVTESMGAQKVYNIPVLVQRRYRTTNDHGGPSAGLT